MSTETRNEYNCDKCGKKLPTFNNYVEIVTELHGYDTDGSTYWERLHVVIERRYGVHNNGETDKADLCQKCAITILEDTLKRVKKGERLSQGVETSRMLKFNEAF